MLNIIRSLFAGLRKLTIKDCTFEQPEPLLEFLTFLELTVLDLDFVSDKCHKVRRILILIHFLIIFDIFLRQDSTFKITKEFAVQIGSQNPSLEYLIGSFGCDWSDENKEKEITEEIQKFHPRFRRAYSKVDKFLPVANSNIGQI